MSLLEHIVTALRLDVVLLVLAAGLAPWLAYLKGRRKDTSD